MPKDNLIGKIFNRLTVIDFAEPIGNSKRIAWLCQCSCIDKTIKIIAGEDLTRKDNKITQSCGCYNREQSSKRAQVTFTKYSPVVATARKIWKDNYSDISFEDFYEFSQKDCSYCGAKPNNKQNAASYNKASAKETIEKADFIYNGLDRVDNSLGHTKENCVTCCKHCNYAKRDMSLLDFKLWIGNIYNHSIIECQIRKRKESDNFKKVNNNIFDESNFNIKK